MSCLSLHLLWNMVMQIVVRSVCTSREGRASQSYVTSKAWRRNSTPIEAAIKTSPCLTLSSPGRVKLRRGGLERFWKYPNLFRRQSPTSQEMWIHSLCFIIFNTNSLLPLPYLMLSLNVSALFFCKTKRGFPPFFLEPLFGQKTNRLSQDRTKPSKSRNFDFPFVRFQRLRFWMGNKWCPCRYKSWFIAGSKLDICNIGSGSKVSLAKMDGFRIAP